MDSTKFDALLPGFLDELPRKVEDIEAQADLAHVRDVVNDTYSHMRSLMGVSSLERSKGYYHPSDVASEFFCPYAAVQPRLKRPAVDNKDPRSRLILQEGHAIHGILQRYHQAMYGDKFKPEVPARCEALHMAGSADGLLLLEKPYRMVLEYKTISTTAGLPEMGKLAHVLQAHCYEYMLDAGLGMVIYFDKSTNNIVGFPHTFSFQRFQTVIDRILMMEACVQENRMPTPKPNAFCAGCSARDTCSSWAAKQNMHGREHQFYEHGPAISDKEGVA